MPVSDDRADPADSAFDSFIDALTAPLSRHRDTSDHEFEHRLQGFQDLGGVSGRATTFPAGEQTPVPHAPTTRAKNIGVENCPDIGARVEQLVGELGCARSQGDAGWRAPSPHTGVHCWTFRRSWLYSIPGSGFRRAPVHLHG